MNKEDAFKDGFIVIKDAIPISLIEELKTCALSLFGYSEDASIDLLALLEDLERSDSSKFYKFCTRLGQSVAATKIALLPQFVELISGVSGLQPFWLTDGAVFYNSREVTRLQYDWHTEQSYFPNASEAITLWYPWLHSVSEHNGTMLYAEKSNQLQFKAQKEVVSGGLTQMRIDESDLADCPIAYANLDVGDAILFSYKIAHKSGVNLSGRPRTTMIARYTDLNGKWNSGWS